MGMLDDAIREHLELKRRRGADPGEVDREQAEALAPVSAREPDAEGGSDVDGGLDAPLAPETGTSVRLGPESGEQLPETAELDVERTFLDEGESERDSATERHDEHGSSAWHAAEDFELPSAEEVPVEHHSAPEETEAPAEHRPVGFSDEQSLPQRP